MSSGFDQLHGGRPDLLGYRMVSLGKGRSEVSWTPGKNLSNPIGVVHGGFVGLIIDDICGMAIASILPDFRPFPTASMHIDFIRGIPIGHTASCRGVVVRAGRRITVADATITNQEGRLLARGTGTFALNLDDTSVAGFSALDPS